MTRDNIIGLLLIAAVLIGYSIWMAPSEDERLEAQRHRDSIAEVQRQEQAEAAALRERRAAERDIEADLQEDAIDIETLDRDDLQAQRRREQMGFFSDAAAGAEKIYVLESDLLKLSVSTRGGVLYAAGLTDYKTYDHQDLILFSGDDQHFTFNFFSGNRNISTEDIYFVPYLNNRPYEGGEVITQQGDTPLSFSMRAYSDFHTAEQPSYIEFAYNIKPNQYMIDFDVNFVGTRDAVASNTTLINLDWQTNLRRFEKNRQNEQNNTTVYYKFTSDDVSRIRPTRDSEERLTTRVEWISFKQQFFSSALIYPDGFANANISSVTLPDDEEDYLKQMSASINLEFDGRSNQNRFAMQWYLGPNSYRTLASYDLDLERQIPLGWGFFLMSWINRFAVIPIFNYLDGFNLNYGIIILILTLLLKIVLLPIAYKTYVSQAKMRVLKPDIEELGKKFPKKEDAMKKQQATMGLYKKAGVNPMSGCIPMLLQLPILLALFRFFPASIELRQEGFLWADDLSSYDSIMDLPFTIPFYGDHVSLFTLLMAASMVLYTHMNSQMMSSSTQMPGMKTMMYMMPVMLLGIFNSFASGLSYYYFLANVITFGQMFIFKNMIDEGALRAKIEENKKKPVKKSKWQKRMEELSKQQEAQKKRKKK